MGVMNEGEWWETRSFRKERSYSTWLCRQAVGKHFKLVLILKGDLWQTWCRELTIWKSHFGCSIDNLVLKMGKRRSRRPGRRILSWSPCEIVSWASITVVEIVEWSQMLSGFEKRDFWSFIYEKGEGNKHLWFWAELKIQCYYFTWEIMWVEQVLGWNQDLGL